MANNFQITISAVDRATAVVRQINERMAQIMKPFTDLQKASAALGKEIGLDKMAKSLGNVAKAANDVSEKVARIVAPLSAVIGIGSLAGVAELTKRWGELGAEIGRTSATIGISTNDLQALRGAAELSGVSAESLTAGLKTLGDTMQGALAGRNQPAYTMMNKFHMQLRRTANGAVDTTAALLDMADAISKQPSPQSQGTLARVFGLEDQLPLLRKGREGIAQLVDEMKRSGAIMSGQQISAATSFQHSIVTLELSMQGLKNTIGSVLGPVMQPLIDQFSQWVTLNKDLISQQVAEFAKGVAEAIRQIDWNAVVKGCTDFIASVKDAVEWVGGWKNAIIGLVIIMNGSLIGSLINLGVSIARLSLGIIPVFIRTIGLLSNGLIPGLLLRLATLTETVLPALSSAFLSLGVAIEATPIGWIITAIAAVAFAGYELYKHWDDIKRWWHRMWGDMGDDASNGAKQIQDAVNSNIPKTTTFAPGSTLLPGEAEANDAFNQRLHARLSQGSSAMGAASSVAMPQDGLLGMIRKLESSGDSAVSPAGAIGRYQIMPATARGYGYDPAKLTDPSYNTTVASRILQDLQKKYGGDNDAIYAAYNAGPSRADKFIASGHNAAVLPLETQKYLAHAHSIMGRPGPAVETPYSNPNSSQMEQDAAKLGITSSNGASSPQAGVVGSSGGGGTVRVEVILSNAPQGTKVRTSTSGPLSVNTKIGYSMPNGVV